MRKERKETAWHRKWFSEVWKAMSKIIEEEPFDQTLSDSQLGDAVKASGIFCDEMVARDVRIAHNVGNANERRITNYARDFKKNKIQK